MQTDADVTVRPPLRGDELGYLRDAIARPGVPAGGGAHPSVTIGVSGGAPSERYLLTMQLDGSGEGRFRYLDELAGPGEQKRDFSASPADTARIFGLLEPLVEPAPRTLFDPDSLVGFVTLRAGSLECRTVFPVWEAEDAAPAARVRLAAADQSLCVDPRQTPDGLTDLFAEMSSLLHRTRPHPPERAP